MPTISSWFLSALGLVLAAFAHGASTPASEQASATYAAELAKTDPAAARR